MKRRDTVERAGTNPARLARAIGVGADEPRRRLWHPLEPVFAALRERRARRLDELSSPDGRAAQLRFDERRSVGSSATIGNDVGIDGPGY